jgi:hypothetical protein
MWCGQNNYTPVQPERLSLSGPRHSVVDTCLRSRSQALTEAFWRDRRIRHREKISIIPNGSAGPAEA